MERSPLPPAYRASANGFSYTLPANKARVTAAIRNQSNVSQDRCKLADEHRKLLVQDPEGSIQELVFNQMRSPIAQESAVPAHA